MGLLCWPMVGRVLVAAPDRVSQQPVQVYPTFDLTLHLLNAPLIAVGTFRLRNNP
jgi:hypothetical protein